MKTRTVLISGAGIAGPALAYWLQRRGFESTLVEQAPAPRRGGYMIDVWGVGWEAVERMQLLPGLLRVGYRMDELRLVDSAGRRVAGMDSRAYRAALDDRFTSVLRGDLAHAIYAQVEGRVEALFGERIRAIRQDAHGVDVDFEHAATRRFDVVIGADGLHSAVRGLAFGAAESRELYLGYGTASFTVAGYPRRDEGSYLSYCAPGRQVARYALRDGRTAFFFVFADPERRHAVPGDDASHRATLRKLYADAGWECEAILDAMRRSDDLYFDSVSQMRMPRWSDGRVALLGDACFCPSLLAGQGSAFAMLGAYVLAGELQRADGDHAAAFANYHAHLQSYIAGKQQAATRYGNWFAPATRCGVALRNLGTSLMNAPLLSRWLLRRMFDDRYAWPEYPD